MKDLKKEIEINKRVMIIVALLTVITIGMYSSYALFDFTVTKDNIVEIHTSSKMELPSVTPNKPLLSANMIPVYYEQISDTEGVYKKADVANSSKDKWYDYNNKMWANAVTLEEGEERLVSLEYQNILDTRPYIVDLKTLYLDGVDDFYNLGNDNIDLKQNVSLVLRVKMHSLVAHDQVLLSNSEDEKGLSLIFQKDNKLAFKVNDTLLVSNSNIKLDTWYTIVATYNGKDLKLYLNGKEIASKTYEKDILSTNVPFVLGGIPSSVGVPKDNNSNISVAATFIYNDTLGENEINNYFQGDINNYPEDNVVVALKEFVPEYPKYYKITDANELSLDGKKDYLSLEHRLEKFENNKITMVARVKFNEKDRKQIIISNQSTNGGGGLFLDDTNKINFTYYIDDKFETITSSKSINLNTWYTIVGVYDGKYEHLYINSEEVAVSKEIKGKISSSANAFYLGNNPKYKMDDTAFANIIVSDIFIYNDALAKETINKYFSSSITNYQEDGIVINYRGFKEALEREIYLNTKAGVVIPSDKITGMWVWIPRYKYVVFNPDENNSQEQMIEVQFEQGIEKTGDIECTYSENGEDCKDTITNDIRTGVSTYTHPAFTVDGKELTGFWVSKFEMSTDDPSCLNNQDCNKTGMNLYSLPDKVSLRYINNTNMFTNIQNMQSAKNVHGFTGNNLDIHMIKNMEWGAISYLSMSKYGKFGNDLYASDYKEVYNNNYYVKENNVDIYKTGYSGKSSKAELGTDSVLYNDLTLIKGQGYLGAGASTTGTIYGVYDMNGGALENVMGKVTKDQVFSSKDYDLYATLKDKTQLKLGDGTKEVTNWYDAKAGVITNWFTRGENSLFSFANTTGDASSNTGSRAIIYFPN